MFHEHEEERLGALVRMEEMLSLATDMDGHGCLLRVICEASHTPSHKVESRGVMIPLFPGSESGIQIAKRPRIQLWIQIRGWNHNHLYSCYESTFSWIRIWNRSRHKSQKELKSDS